MRQQIPNLITLANLFCGCCALLWVLAGRPDVALWFTLGSFAADTADGVVARALGVANPLGKQLDSLADVVSFGVVPGLMLYQLLAASSLCGAFYPEGYAQMPSSDFPSRVCLTALPVFVLTLCSAYRLGKFNIDTRQTTYFLGLSTPACTVFIVGLALAAHHDRFGWGHWLNQQAGILYAVAALFSWLMVSEIPLAGLKIKGFGWRGNEALISMLLLFVVLLFLIKELAFCAIIVVYILYSVLNKKAIVNT